MNTKFQDLNLTVDLPWGAFRENNLFFDPNRGEVFFKGKYTGWDIIYRDAGNFIAFRAKRKRGKSQTRFRHTKCFEKKYGGAEWKKNN